MHIASAARITSPTPSHPGWGSPLSCYCRRTMPELNPEPDAVERGLNDILDAASRLEDRVAGLKWLRQDNLQTGSVLLESERLQDMVDDLSDIAQKLRKAWVAIATHDK